MDFIFSFVIVVVVLSLPTILFLSYYFAKKRREAMANIAAQLGLAYYEGKGEAYYDLPLFNKGHSQKIYNTMSGSKNGYHIAMFDYSYTTGSGKNKQVHNHSVCVLGVSQCFKSLFIRPENLLDKIAGAIGFDDIDFESREFSSRFYVKSDDKKFAYDIIHPQMMEFLMGFNKMPLIEITGCYLAFYYQSMIKPEQYIGLYNFAKEFYNKTPHYVLEECRR